MSLTLNPSASANSFGSSHRCQSLHTPIHTTVRRVRTPQQSTVKYVEALDHLSTKLKIPTSAVEPTNALQDDGLVPGICRLFLEGRCKQGSRCFQVHVQQDVLEFLRKETLETPSCCYLHGAPCNYEGLPFALTVNIGSKTVGLHSLNPTNYLWSIYNEHGESQLAVSKGRVCREHRRGLCRFGEECGFLHICREIPLDGDEYISATPVSIPRVHNRASLSGSVPASTANNMHHNNGDVAGDGHSQNMCGLHTEDANGAAQSLNASSFNACSFNGGYPTGGLNGHYGNYNNQCTSFLGGESGCGSLASVPRSRTSFSYRMKNMASGDSEDGVVRGPLLRPLGGVAPSRGLTSQRHNPYGDASSPQ
ncbi:hypothetical protein TraAM80_02732 [Trypanosoma rangeli]|uniref:C3H1-type domain-containing protein n=1 Tax=Trypanosoma rangeli TaxID=5698 RepID=A0A3R7MUT8_TRYRA|nr:uncharacterized protein TraAM80_02732 [Trypanosoma rangeli]RNF08432.1 hypothetical protein TraAM80_02732 [Trypanosoma rangeli]|eukprot:RNF08432.1 hypothetical protein TraAM80_02732 [Trypanosoma rangeli]